MTMSPRGEVVVAHQQGDEASVVFHHVRSGKPLLWLRVPLRDVRDIAYHPSSGALYALDAAGVHRVDSLIKDGDLTAVAQKLVALKSGKSIAIAKDGTLYMVAGNKILSARP